MIRFAKILFSVSLITLTFSHCQNANSLAREGFKYLDQGKKITALKYFEEALDSNKKNALALYGKGKIMTESPLTMSLGQKLIESALPKLDGKFKADAVRSLGKSYAVTNLYNRAIKILDSSINEGLLDPEIYIDLSFYYMQVLEKVQARNILVKGLKANPQSILLYKSLSNFDAKYLHDYTSALQSLEMAYKIDSKNQDVLQGIAVLYYKLGNSAKAVEYLNDLRSLQTDNDKKVTLEKWIIQAQSGKWQINL